MGITILIGYPDQMIMNKKILANISTKLYIPVIGKNLVILNLNGCFLRLIDYPFLGSNC